MDIRIFKFLPFTKAEGPGNRACIWVQGCTLRCKGCGNSHSWDINGGYAVDVNSIIKDIIKRDDIQGVTFLGGEPFLQAEALSKIGEEVKKKGLSIVTFTGYTYEELVQRNDISVNNLLQLTDLLIDGGFIKELPENNRPWVGSTNQRFIFLTDRYRELEDKLNSISNRVEITLKPNGEIVVNGMTNFEELIDIIDSI